MQGGEEQPLQPVHDIFENWDYKLNLEVGLELAVDFSKAARELKFEEEELALEVKHRDFEVNPSFVR